MISVALIAARMRGIDRAPPRVSAAAAIAITLSRLITMSAIGDDAHRAPERLAGFDLVVAVVGVFG